MCPNASPSRATSLTRATGALRAKRRLARLALGARGAAELRPGNASIVSILISLLTVNSLINSTTCNQNEINQMDRHRAPLGRAQFRQQQQNFSREARARSLVLEEATTTAAATTSTPPPPPLPEFQEPIGNQTIAVGRDAQLSCKINNLGNYRTAWLRVEDKGILTIHNNIITRNYRVGLINSGDESNTFVLTIKNVQPSDRGGYMCQINSVPMKYAVGYLDVLTPPVFDEGPGSAELVQADGANNDETTAATTTTATELVASDLQQQDAPSGLAAIAVASKRTASQVTVAEGSNATLSCKARGHPEPKISWRREDGQPIKLSTSALESDAQASVYQIESNELNFNQVSRLHSGAYLCIASNGVQPSASQRQVLDVRFLPILSLPQIEQAAYLGQPEAQLDCFVELNPMGSYHWVKLTASAATSKQPVAADANQRELDDLWLIEHDELMQSDKFDIVIKQVNSEKVHMLLNIRRLDRQDFGWYKCIARNSMGLQSSAIRLFEAPSSSATMSIGDSGGGGGGGLFQQDHRQAGSTANQDSEHQSTMMNPRPRAHTRSSWLQRGASTGARSQQASSSGSAPSALVGPQWRPTSPINLLAMLVATVVSVYISLA